MDGGQRRRPGHQGRLRSPDLQEPNGLFVFPVLADFPGQIYNSTSCFWESEWPRPRRDPDSAAGIPSLDPFSGDGGATILIRRRISRRAGVNLLSTQSSFGGDDPVCAPRWDIWSPAGSPARQSRIAPADANTPPHSRVRPFLGPQSNYGP